MFTGFEHQIFLLQERHTEIQNFITKKADRKGILALLLSAEIEFSPLDMKEVAFDVIGSHCLVPDTHVSLFETVYKFTCYLITVGLLVYMYIVGEYLIIFRSVLMCPSKTWWVFLKNIMVLKSIFLSGCILNFPTFLNDALYYYIIYCISLTLCTCNLRVNYNFFVMFFQIVVSGWEKNQKFLVASI